jgi:hypothetical protein
LILLGGFLPSAAHAGPSAQSGTTVFSQIKSNPCNGGGEVSAGGGRTAYLCNGWRGVQGLIDVPVKSWATSPEYPLVGVPFKIGVGVDPNYLRTQFPSSNITFPNQIRFFGYRTEIRLLPFVPSHSVFEVNYNGTISLEWGDSISYRSENSISDRFGVKLVVPSFYSDPEVTGIPSSHSDSYYYKSTDDGNTKDSIIFSGYSSSSSYHAKNPTTYKGEPAFSLEVISYYEVKARASWDSYQEWVSVKVGERTECRPGPSSSGNIECMAIVGGWWQPGHYVTEDIYDYQWGAAHGAGSTDWVKVDEIDTNIVAWPDGSIHDHIPILIYQAQPILQKP